MPQDTRINSVQPVSCSYHIHVLLYTVVQLCQEFRNLTKKQALPSEMDLGFGTAYVSNDGSSQFFWDEGSAVGQMVQNTRDMAYVGDAMQQRSSASGQMVADAYKQL